MNISDAAHKTVSEYPGGSVALATRMVRVNEHGEEKPMSDAVLRSKVNPNNTTHHLTLAEASEIMGLTENYRMLHALAAEHGFVVQRADTPESGSIIDALLDAGELKGKLCKLISEALEDRIFSLNESRAVASVCGDLQEVFSQIAQHAMAEAMKARAAA